MDMDAYVSYCKFGCGGLVFACVDRPEHAKDTAEEVADLIRDGYHVTRLSCEAVRQEQWCKCRKGKKKAHA
jgi:hypothetical protein